MKRQLADHEREHEGEHEHDGEHDQEPHDPRVSP